MTSALGAHSTTDEVLDGIDLSGTLGEALRRVTTEVERRKIASTLDEVGADSQKAAALLQVSPRFLTQKIKEYGLTATTG